MTTLAGTGRPGASGDGGSAALATLQYPVGLATDGDGGFYIADHFNHKIRHVDADGNISTIAGTGVPGYSGDGGPATQATLNSPTGLTLGDSGQIYIADRLNHRIRRINSDGDIETVAGDGVPTYAGDEGPATLASLHNPTSVSITPSGGLLIADNQNSVIRFVDIEGDIHTFAGNGLADFSGDGGPAEFASLKYPYGVVIAADGAVIIADSVNNRIRRVDDEGTINTIAGGPRYGFSGDGGPATDARLYYPLSAVPDLDGNIYVVDCYNQRIRVIWEDGIINTVVGNGEQGFNGDGLPALETSLNNPAGILVVKEQLIFSDTENNRVRSVTQ